MGNFARKVVQKMNLCTPLLAFAGINNERLQRSQSTRAQRSHIAETCVQLIVADDPHATSSMKRISHLSSPANDLDVEGRSETRTILVGDGLPVGWVADVVLSSTNGGRNITRTRNVEHLGREGGSSSQGAVLRSNSIPTFLRTKLSMSYSSRFVSMQGSALCQ
jgi:hypothetical protein